MDNRIGIDRSFLIPVAIGALSLIGICIALWIGLRPTPQPQQANSDALPGGFETPFQYELLATETYTPDPSLVTEDTFELDEESEFTELLPTEEFELFETPLPTLTDPLTTNTPVTIRLATPTIDEFSDEYEELENDEELDMVFPVGIYDDIDYRIDYIGDWTSELFVANAHEQTLNVSNSSGNTAAFVFLGRQIVIGYVASSDLGTATVAIDGNPHQLNQASGESWTSPQLSQGEHNVVITHQTGDLLFLDYIAVR